MPLGELKTNLKAVTDEVEKAIFNLESTVRGGVTKKKVRKRQVDVLYDSFGKWIIKNPRKTSRKPADISTSTQSTGTFLPNILSVYTPSFLVYL